MQYLKIHIKLIIILTMIICCTFCNNSKKDDQAKARPYSEIKKEYKQELLDLNKSLVSIDYEVINRYIERHKWNMEISETGLYYQILQKTDGKQAEENLKATFEYNISKLDGSLLYSSKEDGSRSLIIGKNQEESGLNEGLLLMKEGEKARFILPPHLAFGVPGDGYRVPYFTTLLYEIKLIELENINKE